MARILTIWPARKDWSPGGSWRQDRRWVVLDVTKGISQAVVVERCQDRGKACTRELALRREPAR